MPINELNQREFRDESPKTRKAYDQLEKLLNVLRKKNLSDTIISSINSDVDKINNIQYHGNAYRRLINNTISGIIELVAKEMKIVPANYYRNYWMSLGLAVFGLPLGVVFGSSLGNMAFIGVGLPIGLVIGQVVGTQMDKKALEEGRQIDISIE